MIKVTDKGFKNYYNCIPCIKKKKKEERPIMLNRETDYLIITHIKLGMMKNISEMKITVDELTAYQEETSEIENIVIKAVPNETKREKIK